MIYITNNGKIKIRGDSMINIDSFFKDKTYPGIIVSVEKDFAVSKANQLFLDLNGYDENTIKNVKFTDMIVPKDKASFLNVLYKNDITQDITVQLYHKTGAFRFYTIIVLTFDQRFMILGNEVKREFFGYDYHALTTDTKDVGSIFRHLEIQDVKEYFSDNNPPLNFVLDVLPIDVWVKDKFAKYVYCNDNFTKHTGHTREYVKNKSDFELFDKDIAQEFIVSDNKAIESKEKINYVFESRSEKLLTWTNVTKIPLFNRNGVYIGIIGFSIDITENKNIELKYQNELQRTENIL